MTGEIDLSTAGEFGGALDRAVELAADTASSPARAANNPVPTPGGRPVPGAVAAVVVLEVGAVGFMSATGLGELARVRAQAAENGVVLRLAAPGRRVRRVLELSGLEGQFPIDARLAADTGAARRRGSMTGPRPDAIPSTKGGLITMSGTPRHPDPPPDGAPVGDGALGARHEENELLVTAAAILRRRCRAGRYPHLTEPATNDLISSLDGTALGYEPGTAEARAELIALAHRVLDDDHPEDTAIWTRLTTESGPPRA